MGRVRQGLFAATCLLICQTSWAQGWHGAPHPYTDPNLNYAPIPGTASYSPMYAPNHLQTGQGDMSMSPELMQRLLPADRGFLYDQDSRFDLVLRERMTGSWITIEYLNWEVQHQQRALMGATTRATPGGVIPRDPTVPFDLLINDNDPLLQLTGRAATAHTGSTDWSDINGIRGSFGIPLTDHIGLEASAWGLESTTDILDTPRLPPLATVATSTDLREPPQFVVVPLFTNGQPGTTLIVYDSAFSSSYKTEVWSADASLSFNHRMSDYGWTLQSLWGFRHLEYNEKFGFSGAYGNIDTPTNSSVNGVVITLPRYDQSILPLAAPVSNRVESDVDNYLYGMQLGIRTEYRHKYFTVGAEPKVVLAANVQRGSVVTENLREPGDISGLLINDPVVSSSYSNTGFSPGLDLSTYVKLHLTDWMNVKVGYSSLWLDQLGTADKNIFYNDNGPLNPPGVVVRQSSTSRFIHGLTVGAEILLP